MRRLIAIVALLVIGLSSVEVLFAEAELITLSSVAWTTPAGVPASEAQERHPGHDVDCTCLCACSCTQTQSVVLPQIALAANVIYTALPAVSVPERAPASVPLEPRHRPPLA